MKINKITLHNFRAFYGTHTIDTAGKNVLIYGENGSGKSSLYKAFEHFFQASVSNKAIEANAFLYKPAVTPFVSFEMCDVCDEKDTTKTSYVYEVDSVTPPQLEFGNVHIQNPFFTYKRILEIYIFRQSDDVKAKLFEIIFDVVLRHTHSPILGKTFGQAHKEIMDVFSLHGGANLYKSVNTPIKNFGDALQDFLDKIALRTNEMLENIFSII